MREIVYIDLYFFLNTTLDALCIYITSRILAIVTRPWRLLLGAAFGGTFSVFLLLLPIGKPLCILLFVGSLLLCCLIAFPQKSLSQFLKNCLFFFLSLSLLGGSVSALQSVLGISFQNQKIGIGTVCLLLFFSISIALYLSLAKRRFQTRMITLSIILNNTHFHLSALVDSGNLLIEQTSGLCACLIAKEVFEDLFAKNKPPTPNTSQKIEITTPSGHASLNGFVVENAYTVRRCKKHNLKPFFLAIDEQSISYGGCDMLISPTILPLGM